MGTVYRRKVRYCTACSRRLDTSEAWKACRTAGHAIEVRQQSIWWIRHSVGGRAQSESSRSTKRDVAQRLLWEREQLTEQQTPIAVPVGTVTFEEAAEELFNDYTINKKRSLKTIQQKVDTHLRPYFGNYRMTAITTVLMRQFIMRRQEAGASNGEINRELGALRRMFSLAIQNGRLLSKPYMPMLKEGNARAGFFEPEQFRRIRDQLKPHYRGVVSVAYITGWRTPSEILPLQWTRVDMHAGKVRLDPGTTKNGEARVFPFTAELRDILEQQARGAEALKKAGVITPYVFFQTAGKKAGRRVTEHGFAKAWQQARIRAGCPDRIPHDFRRTAVRNLVRARVPERVAMQLTGHKTRAVFERYNIVSPGDLRDAAQRLDRFASTG